VVHEVWPEGAVLSVPDRSSMSSRDGRAIIGMASLAAGIGAVVSVLVAVTADDGPYWSSAGQLVLYLAASIVISGLLGLVFGVPKGADGGRW
jgi:hypothetical protein